MDCKVGVHLCIAIGNSRGHQCVLMHDMLDQIVAPLGAAGQGPHMHAGQALAWQGGQPFLRYHLAGGGGYLARQRHGIELTNKSPGDELGVHFPAQTVLAQIHPQMGRFGIGHGQVLVAQQPGHMGSRSRTLGRGGQHHDMRDSHRCHHGLWRTRVDFVVQRVAIGVLIQGHVRLSDAIVAQACRSLKTP